MVPVVGSVVGAGLLTAFASGYWPTKESVSLACPHRLNSDWARVTEIVKHRTNWTTTYWEGNVQCYQPDGSMAREAVRKVRIPLNGCPADASIKTITASRKVVDEICDSNRTLSSKLAVSKIGKRFDGTPLLFERDSILEATSFGKDGNITVSDSFAYKGENQRWAPMIKDLWVLMNAESGRGTVVFKKVSSLFNGVRYTENVIDSFLVEDVREFGHNKGYLALLSSDDVPAMVKVVRNLPFPGGAGPYQLIRSGWGQMRVERVFGIRSIYKGSKYVGTVAQCFSEDGGWDTSHPQLALPLKKWASHVDSDDVVDTMNAIDRYCLERASGYSVVVNKFGQPVVFREADILGSIDVASDNSIRVSTRGSLRPGPDDWTQDPQGRWIPRDPVAWVALTKRGTNGSILFHKVGAKTGWGEAMVKVGVNLWRKVWGSRSPDRVMHHRARGVKLEARKTRPTIIDVTLVDLRARR